MNRDAFYEAIAVGVEAERDAAMQLARAAEQYENASHWKSRLIGQVGDSLSRVEVARALGLSPARISQIVGATR